MAEVFLASMAGIGGFQRRVVIKWMLPLLAADEQMRLMFIDEAHLAAALDHPNIVKVLDLGEASGRYYMVLELIDGPDLATIVRAGWPASAPVPVELAVYIAQGIALGLSYAHGAVNARGEPLRLVHRDITPHNVLLSRFGEVKLTDFGVAKSDAQTHQTRTGVIKGKVPYLSPEQIHGNSLDGTSDVFSLGIVLYELFVGGRLYQDSSELRIMQRICDEIPLAPSSQRPDVDASLDALVLAMLAKDPADRPSAAHVGDKLGEWLENRPGGPWQEALRSWLTARGQLAATNEARARENVTQGVSSVKTVRLDARRSPPPADAEHRIELTDVNDLSRARVWARTICRRHSGSPRAENTLTTAISELARAMLQRGGGCTIEATALESTRSILVVAKSSLPLLQAAAAKDFDVVRRLCDDVEVDTGPTGTAIRLNVRLR